MLKWFHNMGTDTSTEPPPSHPILVDSSGGRTSPVFIRNGVHKPHPSKHSKKSPHSAHHSSSTRNIHAVSQSTVTVHPPTRSPSDHRSRAHKHGQQQQPPVQRSKSTKSLKQHVISVSAHEPRDTHSVPLGRHTVIHHNHSAPISSSTTTIPSSHSEHSKHGQHGQHGQHSKHNKDSQHRPRGQHSKHRAHPQHAGYQHLKHHPTSTAHDHRVTYRDSEYRDQLRPSLASRHSRESRRKHHKSRSHFSRTSSAMDKDLVIESLEDQLRAQEEVISALTADLAKAQQTILCMTSMVDVEQKLPTVDELQSKLQSLRDQQHADTSTALKQWIRSLSPEWPKPFISQIVHELMFETLMRCFDTVRVHHSEIYRNIAVELGIADPHALSLDAKQMEVVANLLANFFRNHFERILRRKEVVHRVMLSVRAQWTAMGIAEVDEDSAAWVHLLDYVDRACSVCWIMVLQDPPLCFEPTRFAASGHDREADTATTSSSKAKAKAKGKAKAEGIVFDEALHKRVIGSDRRSHNVLYFVWPALSNGADLCGNAKMDVVVRDKWPQMKRAKGRTKTAKLAKERERNVLSVVQAITDEQLNRTVQHSQHGPDLSQFQYPNGDDEPWPCLNKQCAVYIDNQHEIIESGRRQRTCPGCGTVRFAPGKHQDVFVD